ncbi:DUF4386 domain-containing protein [Candidatus Amarolinea dominans]|uniref:DUF4386 domain-containing protein n=1 Tax=Candidatus Amarolinea dominans TaxID=3140696 RepID=UPI0031CC5F57
MNADRKIAILAGVLYFLGIIAGVFSMVPVIDIPDYLVQISANAGQVNSGAFFQFLMTAAHVGMAITLYPILKKHNESLALGYVGSRLIAAAFNVIGVVILLLLLTLSQEFVKAGTPVSSHFQTIGELLRTGRDLVNHVGVILVMSMGSLMFYYLLYQIKLVRVGWRVGVWLELRDHRSKLLVYVPLYQSDDIRLYGFSTCPARDCFRGLADRQRHSFSQARMISLYQYLQEQERNTHHESDYLHQIRPLTHFSSKRWQNLRPRRMKCW